jgi:hypothetical protein
MRCVVSWMFEDGTISEGADWSQPFEFAVPSIGDRVVIPMQPGQSDAAEVVERWVYFDDDNDDVWHLFVKSVDFPLKYRGALVDCSLVETIT